MPVAFGGDFISEPLRGCESSRDWPQLLANDNFRLRIPCLSKVGAFGSSVEYRCRIQPHDCGRRPTQQMLELAEDAATESDRYLANSLAAASGETAEPPVGYRPDRRACSNTVAHRRLPARHPPPRSMPQLVRENPSKGSRHILAPCSAKILDHVSTRLGSARSGQSRPALVIRINASLRKATRL